MIGRFTESALLARAKEVVEEKSKASSIFDEEAEKALPQFKLTGENLKSLVLFDLEPCDYVSSSCKMLYPIHHPFLRTPIKLFIHSTSLELKLGKVLGRGGFCVVNEVAQFNLEPNSPLDIQTNGEDGMFDEEEDEFGELRYDGVVQHDRAFINRRCLRKGKFARYAIKTLSEECLNDPERYVGGVIDLAVESRFLSVIRHPNIIKMRAISDGNMYDRGFFVVLDRLYETLTLKIADWKKKEGKSKGMGKLMDMKGKKKQKVFTERLLCVYDLSTALEYLHSNR